MWPGPGSNRRPSAFRSRILDTPRWLPIALCHNVVGNFILPVGSRRFSARRGYKRRISVNSGAVAGRRSPLGFQKFGGSGTNNYVTKSAVEMAVYATTTQAMNHLKRAVHELIKLKLDGSVDGTKHRVVGYHIPREWSMEPAAAAIVDSARSAPRPGARPTALLDRRAVLPADHTVRVSAGVSAGQPSEVPRPQPHAAGRCPSFEGVAAWWPGRRGC